jgi:hypothetical protein
MSRNVEAWSAGPAQGGELGAGQELDPPSRSRSETVASGVAGTSRFQRPVALGTWLAVAGMRQSPEWPGLEGMAPTHLYDGAITADDALWNERAAHVSAPTLVLFSEGTSEYLADSARRAADSIPNALGRTLPGNFHDVDLETLAGELAASLAP